MDKYRRTTALKHYGAILTPIESLLMSFGISEREGRCIGGIPRAAGAVTARKTSLHPFLTENLHTAAKCISGGWNFQVAFNNETKLI